MSLPAVGDVPTDPATVQAVLDDLDRRLSATDPVNLGFPSTLDLDVTPLMPLLGRVLNNVGDPRSPGGAWPAHSRDFEVQVVDTVADLLRAPVTDRWGYVTSGGTEGIVAGLLLARTLYPDAVVYHSAAAHYAVAKAAALLRMDTVVVAADDFGEMVYADLRAEVGRRRDRAAVIVASVGTTLTEAVDDVRLIRATLARLAMTRVWIHADAALTGLYLALDRDTATRPGFDLADGATSVSVSLHKFLGLPAPAGVIVTRRGHRDLAVSLVDYLRTSDTTILGSRSGHTPLMAWYALHRHGLAGLRRRAAHARALAEYTVTALERIGWDAWRNPHAVTVVLATPPEPVLRRWHLAAAGPVAHLVCRPDLTTDTIDTFVADLAAGSPAQLAPPRPPDPPASPGRPQVIAARNGNPHGRLRPAIPAQFQTASPG